MRLPNIHPSDGNRTFFPDNIVDGTILAFLRIYPPFCLFTIIVIFAKLQSLQANVLLNSLSQVGLTIRTSVVCGVKASAFFRKQILPTFVYVNGRGKFPAYITPGKMRTNAVPSRNKMLNYIFRFSYFLTLTESNLPVQISRDIVKLGSSGVLCGRLCGDLVRLPMVLLSKHMGL